MTKEVDFLSLSKSNNTNSNNGTKNSTDSSVKKEGLSLFDSLLLANKKDTKTVSSDDLKGENTTSKENTSLENSSKNYIENNTNKQNTSSSTNTNLNTAANTATTQTKTLKVDENLVKAEVKNSQNEEVKTTQSSSSLMDKMIIEASKKIESKTQDSSIKNEIKTQIVDDAQSTKITENTTEKSEIKSEIKPETKLETKTQTSLELDTKVEAKLDNNANPKTVENKEQVKTQTNLELDTKVEAKLDNNTNPKAVENKEQVKAQTNLEIDTKVETTDTKQAKTIPIKDQIQTTLDFEETTNTKTQTNIQAEPQIKDNLKNSNNLEQSIVQNKTQNINLNSEEKLTQVVESKVQEEIKDTSKTEKINTNTVSNIASTLETSSKKDNETPVKEPTKLDSSAIVKDEQRVNIDKNNLLNNTEPEIKNTKSLMDRLLDNALKTVQVAKNINQATNDTSTDLNLQNNTATKANDFITNILLGTQKNSIYNQMLATKSEGIKLVKDAKSLDDVKKGADILNLGLKEANVEVKTQTLTQAQTQVETQATKQNPTTNNNENDLNKLAFNRNHNISNEQNQEQVIDKKQEKIQDGKNTNNSNPIISSTAASATSTILATSTVIEEPITLNVLPSLALSIQNRIIGAQQHMSSMMSDIARNMYENYKPPVTVFRINLFPAQLGQIAILMKSDKENQVNISLNMSSANTLEAFIENQNALRDALNRNFNANQTTFNLDFNMDNQGSSNHSTNEDNKQNNKTVSSNDIIEAINENQDLGEDLNYL